MVTRCSECGKHFDILYPDLWAYKTGSKIFCSWHCLRADERKEEDEMARLKKDGTPWGKPGPRTTTKTTKVPAVPPVEIPEQSVSIAPTPLVLQGGVDYQLKVDEAKKPDGDWTIPAIRHKVFGEWYYDREHNRIDWRTPDGDEVSFSPDGWNRLMNEVLPEAMKRLGVEV